MGYLLRWKGFQLVGMQMNSSGLITQIQSRNELFEAYNYQYVLLVFGSFGTLVSLFCCTTTFVSYFHPELLWIFMEMNMSHFQSRNSNKSSQVSYSEMYVRNWVIPSIGLFKSHGCNLLTPLVLRIDQYNMIKRAKSAGKATGTKFERNSNSAEYPIPEPR